MEKLTLVLIFLLAFTPVMAMDNRILFIETAVAGGCTQDMSSVELWYNWDATTCTSLPANYTPDDGGAEESSWDLIVEPFGTSASDGPLDAAALEGSSCGFQIINTGSDGAGYWRTANIGDEWGVAMDNQGSIGWEFRQPVGGTAMVAQYFFQIGGGDDSILCREAAGDIICQWDEGSVYTVDSGDDATEIACGTVLDSDNLNHIAELRWRTTGTSTDFLELYFDDQLCDKITGDRAAMAVGANDDFDLGDKTDANGDYDLDRVGFSNESDFSWYDVWKNQSCQGVDGS